MGRGLWAGLCPAGGSAAPSGARGDRFCSLLHPVALAFRDQIPRLQPLLHLKPRWPPAPRHTVPDSPSVRPRAWPLWLPRPPWGRRGRPDFKCRCPAASIPVCGATHVLPGLGHLHSLGRGPAHQRQERRAGGGLSAGRPVDGSQSLGKGRGLVCRQRYPGWGCGGGCQGRRSSGPVLQTSPGLWAVEGHGENGAREGLRGELGLDGGRREGN